MKKWLKKILLAVFLLPLFWGGCDSGDQKESPPALIAVESQEMTKGQFEQSFDLALTGYPPNIGRRPGALAEARQNHLSQMVERLLIFARAAELGLAVSDAELKRAVQNALRGYSEEALEGVLLKAAIPFSAWKEELANQMLMEKVVDKELGEVSSADRPEAYSRWIEELRRRYPIRIDRRGVEALIAIPPQTRKRTENGSE